MARVWGVARAGSGRGPRALVLELARCHFSAERAPWVQDSTGSGAGSRSLNQGQAFASFSSKEGVSLPSSYYPGP